MAMTPVAIALTPPELSINLQRFGHNTNQAMIAAAPFRMLATQKADSQPNPLEYSFL